MSTDPAPIEVSQAGLTDPLTSLRSKVSHTWLDHEIAMVDRDMARERWASHTWPAIAQRWKVLMALARAFADAFDDYCAASLVERLDVLAVLSPQQRAIMKSRLGEMHSAFFNPVEVRVEYTKLVDRLCARAEEFFALSSLARDASDFDEFDRRWQAVTDAGRDLKDLFTSGRLPSGVLLP